MNNNNNGLGFVFFIIMMMMFGVGGVVIPLLFNLIPIFIVVFIITNITKASHSSNRAQYSRVSKGRKDQGRNLSNRDRNRIDKKLSTYFQKNIKLPIVDGIALTTKNGNYTVIEDLYISMADELVLSIDEFKNYYPDMYTRICELLLAFAKQSDEVTSPVVETPKVEPKVADISESQKYIDKINALNIDIPNEEVKNGLYQTSALLKQIDLYADKEDADKLKKLYEYYLPILTKILENYKELGKFGAGSEEFKKNEVQLIKTIVLINEALKEMNKSLHEDDYMNLSADITTLQSILKKDGLVNRPFQKEDDNG